MITSRLTNKARTTIPERVRSALELAPGDELAYTIIGRRVVLTNARLGGRTEHPIRVFAEWSSAADAKAYAKL